VEKDTQRLVLRRRAVPLRTAQDSRTHAPSRVTLGARRYRSGVGFVPGREGSTAYLCRVKPTRLLLAVAEPLDAPRVATGDDQSCGDSPGRRIRGVRVARVATPKFRCHGAVDGFAESRDGRGSHGSSVAGHARPAEVGGATTPAEPGADALGTMALLPLGVVNDPSSPYAQNSIRPPDREAVGCPVARRSNNKASGLMGPRIDVLGPGAGS